jgi:hypothetical protein
MVSSGDSSNWLESGASVIAGLGRSDVSGFVDCAVSGACQVAVFRNRAWASANPCCQGQADTMASLMRRKLMRTKASGFGTLSRKVPQVASVRIDRRQQMPARCC